MGHHRIVIGIAALLLAAGLITGQDDGSQEPAMEVLWNYQAATESDDLLTAVAFDAEGNCLAAGKTSGRLGGEPRGNYDVIVVKFDADGTRQWIHQFGGVAREDATGIAADAEGNCYVTGNTNSGIFDNILPQAGNQTATDIFLVKYDGDGEQVWALRFGLGGRDRSFDLAIDDEGNCFLAGDTTSSLEGDNQGYNDAFLAKFTTDGELVWTRQIGTPAPDIAYSVTLDAAGNCYLGGRTSGEMDGQNSGYYDIFIAKFDPDGEQLWVRQYGSASYDLCADLAYDDENECLYAVGNTSGDLVTDSAGLRDGWVVQFDSDGNWLWGQQIGTDGADVTRSVVADSEGCYVGGRSGGLLEGTNWNGHGMYLARFDIDGNVEWTHQFGPVGKSKLHGLAVDGKGNCAVVGENSDDFIGPSQGRLDGFLVKLIHENDKAE